MVGYGSALLTDFHHPGMTENNPSPNQLATTPACPYGPMKRGLAGDLLRLALATHGVAFLSDEA